MILNNLIGKWDGKGNQHPLIFHCLDTAYVLRVLWDRVFGSHLKQILSRSLHLEEEQAGKVLSLVAGLHDLGKASPVFQERIPEQRSRLEVLSFPFPHRIDPDDIKMHPHNFITAKVLSPLLSQAWPGLSSEVAKTIAQAVGGHHGGFPKYGDLLNLRPQMIGEGLWGECRQDILRELQYLLGLEQIVPNVPEPPGEFYLQLAALVSLADWLASDENRFPYKPEMTVKEYEPLARAQAAAVIDDLRWAHWSSLVPAVTLTDLFPQLPPPRPLQQQAQQTAKGLDQPALVLIEAPMGEGKTEAALYIADRWLNSLDTEGVYFALPTMATSNQMFERVKRYLDHRFAGGQVNLMLLHGRASRQPGFKAIRPGNISDETDAQDSSPATVAEGWFQRSKRGLLAPFGVGTIDQALLAVLQVKHVFVRLQGLAQKVLIVDEVHAYDVYMSRLLERLLKWLAALGSPVILLSATLPAARRSALLAAYGTAAESSPAHYPRISVASPGKTAVSFNFPSALERRVALERRSPEPAKLAFELEEALHGGGCAAVMVNTVNRAQEMYRAVRDRFGEEHSRLLHARFPFYRRLELEEVYLAMFSKEGRRPERFVLVGTQVLEQSLDLDFDLMATDLAPLDLMLQRMGRLHRHDRSRPSHLTAPVLWLLSPPVEDDGPHFIGKGRPYSEYVLLRSWLTLEGRTSISLPGEMEELIESVYGDGTQAIPSELEKRFEEAHSKLERDKEKLEFSARQRLIPDPDGKIPRELLEGISYLLSDEESPKLSQELKALTRLSDTPSVQVICLHQRGEEVVIAGAEEATVDLQAKERPPVEIEDQLAGAVVTLSDRRVAGPLLQRLCDRRNQPPGWRRSPLLRYACPLIFINGCVTVNGIIIELDPNLGLVLTKE